MGRPIVYCDTCGDRILDDEFEKRRAVSAQNKNYCAKCARSVFGASGPPDLEAKPKPAAPDAARPPTAFLAKQGAPHRSHHARPAAKGAPIGVIVGAAVGVVVLIVIVVAAASSGGGGPSTANRPESPKAAPRDEAARRAFEEIQKLATPEITDPEKVLAAAQGARSKVADTAYASQLEELEDRARKRRDELARKGEFAKLLAQMKEIELVDREFQQLSRFDELNAKADTLAQHVSRDATEELAKVVTSYQQGFQRAATVKAAGVRQKADALALDNRPAEGARVIDQEFTGVWRKSAAWTDLEARKRELEMLASKPPEEKPRPAAGRDRFGALREPPKAGEWVNVLEGAGFRDWDRLGQANEDKGNWKLENGVLKGRSSKASGPEGQYADIFMSLSNGFTDFEIEFTARTEGAGMLIATRYDPGDGTTQPKMAAALLHPSADFLKVRIVVEGNTGKVMVAGQNDTPMDVSFGAASGRLLFALEPGASVTFKELKVLRKK